MKKVITTIVLLLSFQVALAQDHNNKNVRFGIRAGLNLSHINFSKGSPPPETPIETSWYPGANAGLLMIVPIGQKIFVQPEYLFSQMGGDIEGGDTTYNFNYFSLPVLFRWELNSSFAVLVGPQFDLLINGNKEREGSSSNSTHDIEHRSLGATAELEYTVIDSFSIGARYMHGLNHIGLLHENNLQEFKYELFQISAIYKF